MQDLETKVTIVGGGPVGNALAIALGQRGIECCVVERHAAPQRVPKGQNLTQRTMEHFRSWGIEKELRTARTLSPETPVAGLTAYGTLLSGRHHPWLQRELVRDFYATDNERLPQYRTEEVLRDRVNELSSVTVLPEWTVREVTQTDQKATVVAHAPDGSTQRIHAEYVVGCDGSRSITRQAAGITTTQADDRQLMVLAVFRSPHFDDLVEHLGASFMNVLHPSLDGYWQFFGRVDDRETWFFHCPVPPDTTRETVDLSSLLIHAIGTNVEFEVEHLGFWELRFELADTYRSGRVFIAGDAAHSHPPYGGYGINTGFEDAANLAWKLAASVQEWAGPELLSSYDAERRPVFASVRDDFIRAGIEKDRTFLSSVDPETDPESFEQAWLRRTDAPKGEVDSYEPNYERSPIVGSGGHLDCEHHDGEHSGPSAIGTHLMRARVGHHLAPGLLDDGSEIFDSFKDRFTLLVTKVNLSSEFVVAARNLGIPLQVGTLSSASAANYAADMVLVRPDHFVAWIAETTQPEHQPADQVLRHAVGY